jgi:hypothetical protein
MLLAMMNRLMLLLHHVAAEAAAFDTEAVANVAEVVDVADDAGVTSSM